MICKTAEEVSLFTKIQQKLCRQLNTYLVYFNILIHYLITFFVEHTLMTHITYENIEVQGMDGRKQQIKTKDETT